MTPILPNTNTERGVVVEVLPLEHETMKVIRYLPLFFVTAKAAVQENHSIRGSSRSVSGANGNLVSIKPRHRTLQTLGGSRDIGEENDAFGPSLGDAGAQDPTPEPATVPPSPAPTASPPGDDYLTQLEIRGKKGIPESAFPLDHCQGICQNDNECGDGFICMRRNATESIPGCSGEGKTGKNYCFDPSKAITHRFRLHWEEAYNWQGRPNERFFCVAFTQDNGFTVEKCHNENVTMWEFVRLSDFGVGEGYQIKMSRSDMCIGLKPETTNKLVIRPCQVDNTGQRWVSSELGDTAAFDEKKFDIRPVNWKDGCMTQPHHPKKGERLFIQECGRAFNHDTSFWTKY